MRTKTLLIAAAALVAGVVSSEAQVYSANVVGYVNIPLTNGFNLVANQLDLDGNLTNNTLYSVIGTNLPNLSKVYAYVPSTGTYSISTFSAASSKWIGATAAADAALTPGQGVFVYIPPSATLPQTITEVGNVIQGTNTVPVSAGFQIVSSIPPISGGLQTDLGYVPTHLDKVYLYNPLTGTYSIKTYNTGTTWVGGEPTPAVGEAFFLDAAGATTWTQAFTVQ